MPPVAPRLLTEKARLEWRRLELEHRWLQDVFSHLRDQYPANWAQHEDLKARLRTHGAAVAAWRERHLGQH